MLKPYLALILCLLLGSFVMAQDEPSPYELAQERIAEALEEEAESLYLSDIDLRTVPPEIGELVNLRTLYLSYNQLSSLPAEIGQLVNLRELSLAENQLTSLPAEIGRLTYLEFLSAEGNQLSQLPAEIGLLTNLNTIYMDENNISRLPDEIGALNHLQYLSLAENRLTSLPAEIGQLESLRTLNLANNALTSLPVEIGQLTNLNSLTLMNNQLTSLPAEIGLLNNLEYLHLAGNPLSSLPPEIENLALYSLSLDEHQGNVFSFETRRLGEGSHEVSAELWFREPGMYFIFSGEAGETVFLSLESDDFDAYLILSDANGVELASNDDIRRYYNYDSEIGPMVLPYTGEYTVFATSYNHQVYFDSIQGDFTFNLLRLEGDVVAVEITEEATAEVTAEATAPACDLSVYIAPSCPHSQIETAASLQTFEGGRMIWLQMDGSISVFYNNGTYLSGLFGGAGEPLPEVTEVPDGLLQPQLGFGYVWLNTAGVREGLGWATSGESYYTALYETLGEASASSQYVYLSMPDGSSIWMHPYTHTWGTN